jgi:Fic/DOC family
MGKKEALKYRVPDEWFRYDAAALMLPFSRAEGSVRAFVTAPFERGWLEEAARSRRLREITASCALAGHFVHSDAAEDLAGVGELTPAQSEVRAAARAYDWLSQLPVQTPLSDALVTGLHGRLRGGGAPSEPDGLQKPDGLRNKDEQVFFGEPEQRGAKGGRECREAFAALIRAVSADVSHSPLIRGLAAHYHLWTLHPFSHGNGRTARALDCFFRQAAGLGGLHFIAMSEFYLSEQEAYRDALGQARRAGHDLTPFLEFSLEGLTRQCSGGGGELRRRTSVVLFRDTMGTLFGDLQTGKKRNMVGRQIGILDLVLQDGEQPTRQVYYRMAPDYASLRNPWKAFLRDVSDLVEIGAVQETTALLSARLSWPAEITPARFLEHYNQPARFSMSGRHPA